MPLPPRPPVSLRSSPLSKGLGVQEIAAPRARFPDSPLRRTGAPRDSGAAMPTRTAALLLPAPRPRAITGCGTGAAASAAETALAARARPRAHGCFPCVRPQVDVHAHQALTNSTGPCYPGRIHMCCVLALLLRPEALVPTFAPGSGCFEPRLPAEQGGHTGGAAPMLVTLGR